MKSEPSAYSIQDLKRDRVTAWDGVRNYQARNFMRDDMRIGDRVLFYHSNTNPPGVAGVARVVREAYLDHTALDPHDVHFDPKATPAQPRWYMVDIGFETEFSEIIPLAQLRADPALANMPLLAPGQRLSVQPLSEEAYMHILRLADAMHPAA